MVKKKILIVGQFFYPDNFRINDIAVKLTKDYNVTVLTGLPDYKTGYAPKKYRNKKNMVERYNNINIIRVKTIQRRKGAIFRSLNYLSFVVKGGCKAFFLKEYYDIVFTFQTSPITMYWPGLIYAKKNKSKKILYVLDLWPESVKAMGFEKNSLIYKLSHKLSRYLYNTADNILVSSPSFKSYLNEVNNVNLEKIDYLPQYSDENTIEKSPLNDKNILTFIFAGNIGYVQNLEILVEALRIINDTNKSILIKVYIIGNGPNLEKIKILVQDYNISKYFMFKNFMEPEKLDYYYLKSDIAILTLSNESLIGNTIPGKLQTYMKKGMPILGAISGDAKKIIEESKSGLCVDSNDIKGLANNILFYYENKQLLEQFSMNSKEYYKKNFSEELFFEELKKNL